MRRRRVIPAVLALFLTATLFTPSGGQSDAQWHDSFSVGLPDGQTDPFTSTAVDVPSPRGDVVNSPTISFTNTSPAQSSWINVQSTEVIAGSLGGQALASAVGLNYRVGAPGGNCSSGTTTYWDARQQGQISLETTHPRTADRVAAATLTQLQQRPLCLEFPRTSSKNDFLRAHGGRDLTIRTTLSQRSELPATWDSQPATIDSKLKVAFPRPMPWGGTLNSKYNTCVTKTPGRTQTQLRWAWPDKDGWWNKEGFNDTKWNGQVGTGPLSTEAVHAWEVWQRATFATGVWTKISTVADGAARTAVISPDLLPIGESDLKIIARLNGGAGEYWVEGTYIINVKKQAGLLYCQDPWFDDKPNLGGPIALP